jgi:hypothetical protein
VVRECVYVSLCVYVKLSWCGVIVMNLGTESGTFIYIKVLTPP